MRSRKTTPTRHNLHAIEDRIELAERGHHVLERKRDGLVLEFLDLLDEYQDAQRELQSRFERAQSLFDRVRALEGQVVIDGLVRARSVHPEITTSRKPILGVALPQFEATGVRTDLAHHGYGLLGMSPVVDELVDAYEALVEQLVAFAELETAALLLVDVIETTQRRVRALEHAVIPRLQHDAERIRRRLDERAQEERVRQKWFKEKQERRRIHADPPGGRVRPHRNGRSDEDER
ncbi:V-type ATP synthase subunit D [Halorubellus salinus]|uniref:V-type ATP synthase subunit D n=1 Tax=Halorubellus salinus TaxID=755309 RepID=UPI001D07B163|nr:V-type ATP synthase subunit D [Halorubellus salinus]